MTRDSQDTLRPEELQEAEAREAELEAEQRELTALLLRDPDPRTRLIAHMSDRQLYLHQQIVEVKEQVAALTDEVHTLLRRRSMTPSGGISLPPKPGI